MVAAPFQPERFAIKAKLGQLDKKTVAKTLRVLALAALYAAERLDPKDKKRATRKSE